MYIYIYIYVGRHWAIQTKTNVSKFLSLHINNAAHLPFADMLLLNIQVSPESS